MNKTRNVLTSNHPTAAVDKKAFGYLKHFRQNNAFFNVDWSTSLGYNCFKDAIFSTLGIGQV